jgi:hypothetical protein
VDQFSLLGFATLLGNRRRTPENIPSPGMKRLIPALWLCGYFAFNSA